MTHIAKFYKKCCWTSRRPIQPAIVCHWPSDIWRCLAHWGVSEYSVNLDRKLEGSFSYLVQIFTTTRSVVCNECWTWPISSSPYGHGLSYQPINRVCALAFLPLERSYLVQIFVIAGRFVVHNNFDLDPYHQGHLLINLSNKRDKTHFRAIPFLPLKGSFPY